jgi:hypothetical protein
VLRTDVWISNEFKRIGMVAAVDYVAAPQIISDLTPIPPNHCKPIK